MATTFDFRTTSIAPSTTGAGEDVKTTPSTQLVFRQIGEPIGTPVISTLNLDLRDDNPIEYDPRTRSLSVKEHSILPRHLAQDIDLFELGANVARVGGKRVNDQDDSDKSLWTAARILHEVNNVDFGKLIPLATFDLAGLMSPTDKRIIEGLRREEIREKARELLYVSTTAQVLHEINHNMDTFDMQYTVMVEQLDGTWKNDPVNVTYTTTNQLVVELPEARNIRAVLKAVGETTEGIETVEMEGAIHGIIGMPVYLADKFLIPRS